MTGDPLERLLSRPKFGIGPAVPRLEDIRQQLPRAQWLSRHRAIHVTGSQGKGSVTTLAAALFDALGVRCGRYISPHLLAASERIWINGSAPQDTALRAAAQAFEAQEQAYLNVHPGEAFGAFEALTALAFNAFAAAQVETAVLEAGIGGRHDATRGAAGTLAALTGIDLEHTALLGAHEADILEDKADICPPGGLLIAGTLKPALRERLGAHAAARGFAVEDCSASTGVTATGYTEHGALVDLRIDDLHVAGAQTRLFGRVQLENAALAILLVKRWLAREARWPGNTEFEAALRAMLSQNALPLRFTRVDEDPVTIIDIAHTGAALRALTKTLDAVLGTEPCVFLIGVSSDKPAPYLLAALRPKAASFVFTRARHRGYEPSALAQLAGDIPVHLAEDAAAAYAEARALARARAVPLVVTGSAFLCAEVYMIAAGNDPAALSFL